MLDDLNAVSDALLAEVAAMGFPPVRVEGHQGGLRRRDAVVTWVLEHGEDPGIDDSDTPKTETEARQQQLWADPVSAPAASLDICAMARLIKARLSSECQVKRCSA